MYNSVSVNSLCSITGSFTVLREGNYHFCPASLSKLHRFRYSLFLSLFFYSFPLVFPVIDKLWTSIYDFLPISFKWQHQQYYIQVLSTQKVLEFINLHLEQLNGMSNFLNEREVHPFCRTDK